MRVLICGSRDFGYAPAVRDLIANLPEDTVVIEGGADGVDKMARAFALLRGMVVMEFPAAWKAYGKAAGPRRNKAMIEHGNPNLVYAFYNSQRKTKGTQNMVRLAHRAGIEVIEYIKDGG
jgi:hypothetical protein